MKNRVSEGSEALEKTVRLISAYFDACKVGCTGTKGFRKTTDLSNLSACLTHLAALGFLNAESTRFVDLGCGDGRVNLLMSYFVKISVGIEIDGEILSEFEQRRADLLPILSREGGTLPPDNIFLFHGSSLDRRTFEEVERGTGLHIEEVDLFYTYITLHDVFAELIAQRGRPGALYLVYGFNRVLPRYESFELVVPDLGSRGIAALFRKTG
ncbi:MAG: class I SAM-dependent methyltransferase [Syntrophobacter sp.]